VFGDVGRGSGKTFLVTEQTVIILIYKSSMRRKNFNRSHHVRGRWVFVGVERGSGKTFLVAERTVLIEQVSQTRVRQRKDATRRRTRMRSCPLVAPANLSTSNKAVGEYRI
jgi:hypothetical protein